MKRTDLTLFQWLVTFASQNLAVLCVNRIAFFVHFSMVYVVYLEIRNTENIPIDQQG